MQAASFKPCLAKKARSARPNVIAQASTADKV